MALDLFSSSFLRSVFLRASLGFALAWAAAGSLNAQEEEPPKEEDPQEEDPEGEEKEPPPDPEGGSQMMSGGEGAAGFVAGAVLPEYEISGFTGGFSVRRHRPVHAGTKSSESVHGKRKPELRGGRHALNGARKLPADRVRFRRQCLGSDFPQRRDLATK
jgi:hypothetical protein